MPYGQITKLRNGYFKSATVPVPLPAAKATALIDNKASMINTFFIVPDGDAGPIPLKSKPVNQIVDHC